MGLCIVEILGPLMDANSRGNFIVIDVARAKPKIYLQHKLRRLSPICENGRAVHTYQSVKRAEFSVVQLLRIIENLMHYAH